jgi:hypothetical protein
MFGVLGVFSEFEREMIVARVNACLARTRQKIERDVRFNSKAGKVRTRLGRPCATRSDRGGSQGLAKGMGVGTPAPRELSEKGEGTLRVPSSVPPTPAMLDCGAERAASADVGEGCVFGLPHVASPRGKRGCLIDGAQYPHFHALR